MANIDALTKHRDFNLNDPLPSPFVDAITAMLAGYVSPNFALTVGAGGTSLQIVAGPGDQQVGISIDGSMRVINANISQAHPSGGGAPSGHYDVYVTTKVLDENQEDSATFDYAFALAIVASGATPAVTTATALQRKVGHTVWNGTKIVDVVTTFHSSGHAPFGHDMRLGTVMEWYRPDANTPVPLGFAVMDGTAWSAIPNDMGLSSGNIPNVYDKFTMAVPLNRIGETGGTNTHNLSHDHGGATGNSAPNTNTAGSHAHGHTLSTANASAGPRSDTAGPTVGADPYSLARHTHAVTGGINNDGSHSHTVDNHSHSISGNLSSTTDNRPAYFGLVKLMKVRHIV